MRPPNECSQSGCDRPPVVRYTWPGKDEAGICAEHLPKLQAVAKAMGLHLQIHARRVVEPAPEPSE
jgi:hypothetical protein